MTPQKYTQNRGIDFIRQIYSGKTLGRILLNWHIANACKDISGHVVDIAGGGNASYYAYLPSTISVVRTNYTNEGCSVDTVVDFNKPLPFPDRSIDAVLLFNALYIAEDYRVLLRELQRVVKKGGGVFISMPFLYNEMKEPHDFCRLTYEGLEHVCREAGFSEVSVTRLGERVSASVNLLHPLFLLNTIRLFIYALALFLDFCIPQSLKRKYPSPIQYFCVAKV